VAELYALAIALGFVGSEIPGLITHGPLADGRRTIACSKTHPENGIRDEYLPDP